MQQTAIAELVQAAGTEPAAPADRIEITSDHVGEWQEATYLLIGTALKQLGRRAIEIKPAELQKFAKDHRVTFEKTANGNLRYTVEKKK